MKETFVDFVKTVSPIFVGVLIITSNTVLFQLGVSPINHAIMFFLVLLFLGAYYLHYIFRDVEEEGQEIKDGGADAR